jgi:aspartate/methionine/tyrosine aminotransferase
VSLSPDYIAVSSGATGIIELSALLLCDEGDVAAFPAPSYPVYTQDIGNKAGVIRYDIVPGGDWDAMPGIHPLSRADLERSRSEIEATGGRLKMLVLTQPDNPTGAIYSAQQLEDFTNWCIAHEVHLCVNELYALSQLVGDQHSLATNIAGSRQPRYASFLRLIEQKKSAYLHWWYSFSKDFGLSGLRTGVIYSRNEQFLEAFGNYAAPSTVSNHTQWLLGSVISDDEWVEAFAKTNQARLTESYHLVTTALDELGVPYRTARGSLFVWAQLNVSKTITDEAYWRGLFTEQGVLLTAPGGFGHDEKGWMRIVYSCVPQEGLREAMRRIKVFSRQQH